MDLISTLGMVVYRMPNQKQIVLFKSGKGSSNFVLSPFDRDSNKWELKGEKSTLGYHQLDEVLGRIKLPMAIEQNSTSSDDYIELIESAKTKITSSDLDKVVLAGRNWITKGINISEFFKCLLENNPTAFVYLFSVNGQVMAGASPELLLGKEGDTLNTMALGGTETHGQYTHKELVEHQQIKDYLEQIFMDNGYAFEKLETSSIKASRVSHLKTPYILKSLGLDNDLKLINCLHPTSAICGLPFKNALNFIKENEGFDRKFYSGYIGPIDPNGDFKLFVNLRCAELYQEGAMLYAGAGINSMSNPKDEWDEINNKMQTIAQCLK